MAALTIDQGFDFAGLTRHLAAALPAYAQPLFVRSCAALDVTGTFKLTKTRLADEGYADISDPVWFNDRVRGAFVPCDAAVLRSISDGGRRL
jgi:fatty-acyl-CoA synthase